MKRIALLFTLLMIILVACSLPNEYHVQHHHNNEVTKDSKQISDTFVASFQQKITMAAVGDLLIHERVYNDAWNGEQYDFRPMLEPISDYLQQPTITMANQETVIGGEELGLSGYPRFNSPFEIADQIKELGVDIVTTANNHTLDHGEEAIKSAINHYEEIGMVYTGSFKSKEDKQNIRVIETEEGISVAFLSYTYGTNGIPVPDGKEYLVNLIDRDQMKEEVERAEQMADVTVLSYHFGNEYERMPSDEQKDLVQYAADLGVEVVIGHHPHVLQPLEWLVGEGGNSTLVAYSLGNFLSGQTNLYRRIGGVLQFSVIKYPRQDNKIIIEDPAFLPTFVDYDKVNDKMKNIKVMLFEDISEEQLQDANSHLVEIKEHMSQYIENVEFIR